MDFDMDTCPGVKECLAFFDMERTAGGAGESIRALRKLAGLTLEDVARLAETSTAYLSKVERGVYVPTRVYVGTVTSAIASALKDAA